MAATKHSLADSEAAARPSKKTKVAGGGEAPGKAQLKKGKKDKEKKDKEKKDKKKKDKSDKREKKRKLEEGAAGTGEGDGEAQSRADKEAKKARKKERREMKLREAQGQEEPNGADAAAAEPRRPKDNKGKDNKDKDMREAGPAYVQTMSLSSVPQADIDAFLALHHIAVADPRASALRPVTDFHHLPSTNLLEKRPSPFAGFAAPTPIQAAAWPYALAGRDVVGVAETGSGKTLAFALPCVEAVAAVASGGTRAVVVSPTRELAMQTHEQLARLAARVGLGCVCLYGGASKDDQRARVRSGCHVVVATPGRLKDLMADGTVSLAAARFVVLDEADRMLDTGFEDDIRAILASCPPRERRQTLMFTATWPQSVQALAASFMVDPVSITIGDANEADGAELQANARIAQRVEVVDPRDKEPRLLQLVRQHQQGARRNDRILVFCLYKKEATRVEGFLARKGVRVGGIHGDLRQEQRTRSLEAFKTGATPVLVATDVAARGLDIPEVKLVINVTFPLTIEDYVHRIGRTGRAGNSGEAVTLFTIQDKAHSGSLVNILKGANQPVPDELLRFGTTVKKKTHDMYGSFFKDVDMNQKATKITFD